MHSLWLHFCFQISMATLQLCSLQRPKNDIFVMWTMWKIRWKLTLSNSSLSRFQYLSHQMHLLFAQCSQCKVWYDTLPSHFPTLWIENALSLIFKSSHFQVFYRIGFLKNFIKFTRKHLQRSVCYSRFSDNGVFLWIFSKSLRATFYRTPPDGSIFLVVSTLLTSSYLKYDNTLHKK